MSRCSLTPHLPHESHSSLPRRAVPCRFSPWAHRTLIVRALKGLESVISYTVVDWLLADKGWIFTDSRPQCEKDPVHGFERLRQVYELQDPNYSGNITVPVLYDKIAKRIVNNESSEIIQMLNSQFNAFSATPAQAALDLYPAALKADVDAVNGWSGRTIDRSRGGWKRRTYLPKRAASLSRSPFRSQFRCPLLLLLCVCAAPRVYPQVNNGVYRCGFATEQGPYDAAFASLFSGLDRLESMLEKQRYLNSDSQLTLADVRLFTTLIRFDTVYHGHFKVRHRTRSASTSQRSARRRERVRSDV